MLLIDLQIQSISWTYFAIVCLLLLVLAVLHFRFVAPQLSESNYRSQESRLNVRLIDRLVAAGLVFILLLAFALIHIRLHLPILLLLLVLWHRSLFNFAQGTVLIQELALTEGQEVQVASFQGVLQSLKWTGAVLAEGDKLTFLPYNYLGKQGLQIVQQDVHKVVSLRCKWGDLDSHDAHAIIENLIFNYPYVIDGTKPSWKYADQHVDISLALTNNKYIDSLCEVLAQNQIRTEVLT